MEKNRESNHPSIHPSIHPHEGCWLLPSIHHCETTLVQCSVGVDVEEMLLKKVKDINKVVTVLGFMWAEAVSCLKKEASCPTQQLPLSATKNQYVKFRTLLRLFKKCKVFWMYSDEVNDQLLSVVPCFCSVFMMK